uniref:Putative secreted protein n=1 Tax=Anopheles marajoara TaxID=58244 RepID=A0A2M4CCQ0_9DIPT
MQCIFAPLFLPLVLTAAGTFRNCVLYRIKLWIWLWLREYIFIRESSRRAFALVCIDSIVHGSERPVSISTCGWEG